MKYLPGRLGSFKVVAHLLHPRLQPPHLKSTAKGLEYLTGIRKKLRGYSLPTLEGLKKALKENGRRYWSRRKDRFSIWRNIGDEVFVNMRTLSKLERVKQTSSNGMPWGFFSMKVSSFKVNKIQRPKSTPVHTLCLRDEVGGREAVCLVGCWRCEHGGLL